LTVILGAYLPHFPINRGVFRHPGNVSIAIGECQLWTRKVSLWPASAIRYVRVYWKPGCTFIIWGHNNSESIRHDQMCNNF